MSGIDQQTVTQEVLSHRTDRWVAQFVQDMPVPEDLPYAAGAEAWAVCIMKKWNELGDEPAWLQGTDEETHQLYYQELYRKMGEAALTSYRIETDLVIYAQGRFHLFSCKPHEAQQPGMITFMIEFPEQLTEEQ